MIKLQVFDPAMCCSTGVCGPSVEPKLVHFAADLDWLKSRGVSVERFNLMQEPAAFAGDAAVKASLEEKGEGALPLIKINGEVKSVGLYPSRDELAAWAGLAAPALSLFTEAVTELVAIAAAVASNSELNLKLHYDRARKLGVSREDMTLAVSTAQGVKDASSRAVSSLAEKLLRKPSSLRLAPEEAPEDTLNKGCC
jgi:hypothetical protein